MSGMTQQEIGEFFTEIKRVFPEAELVSIKIEQENGKMAFLNFKKDEVGDSNNDFELLPSGKYTAQISNHEWKETKSGGHMLALTMEITGPNHEGRKVWDNLNLDCDKEEAQKIAVRTFKAICQACNDDEYYDALFEVEDSDQMVEYLQDLPNHLYGTELTINVGVEKGKDPYPDKNKIKGYMAAASQAKAAPSGKPGPSWGNKKK